MYKTTVKVSRSIVLPCLAAIGVLGYLGTETFATAFQETRQIHYNYLSQVAVASAFYLGGYLARTVLWKALSLYGFIAAFLIMYVSANAGFDNTMVMAWSKYPDGFPMALVRAGCGIYSTFYLSWLLSSERLGLLLDIGRESRAVMSYHLICYLCIDLAFQIGGAYRIEASTPLNHFYSPWAFPIYIILATTIPALSAIRYRKLKARLRPALAGA